MSFVLFALPFRHFFREPFAVWVFFAASVFEIHFRELSWKTPEQKSRALTAKRIQLLCFSQGFYMFLQQAVFCKATHCPFQHGVFPLIFRGHHPRAVRITASEKVSGTILGEQRSDLWGKAPWWRNIQTQRMEESPVMVLLLDVLGL